VLAGAVVYLNSLSAPFIFDDQTAVLNNSQIRQLLPLSVPLSPKPDTPVAGRPLVNLSFALNYAIGRLDVTGYRMTNVAIHLLAALALFGLVRRTLLLPSLAPAFGAHATNLAWAITLIWTLHPLPSETIDYVTQRTESMMGLFYFLTLYCSVRALEKPPGRWQAAAIVCCAAGMACKESMVTAPVMVALFDRVFVGAPALRKIRRTRLYVGLAATWLLLAGFVESGTRTTAGFDTAVSPWTYLLNQAPTLLMYLRFAFWPRNLVLDYGIPRPLTLADVWLPLVLVCAMAAAVLWLLVRRPHMGFLGAWFFITLAPTSSIVPIATEVGADRRMYIPLAALIVLMVLGVYRVWKTHVAKRGDVIGAASVVCVCVLLAASTVQRNAEYASNLSVLQTTVARHPHARSYQLLASAFFDAGQRQEALQYLEKAKDDPVSSFMLGIELVAEGQTARGTEELERYVRLAPTHVRVIDAREALGRVYGEAGQFDRAIAHLNEVLRMDPRRGSGRTFLGEVFVRMGRMQDAVQQYQLASDLQPGNVRALHDLAVAQGQAGQLQTAVVTFRRVIELDPSSSRDHYLLGRALAALGQLSAAVPYFARAVELDPRNAEARLDWLRAQESLATGRR
jgi:tetratricopeptide (TPR) repeat protein